MADFIREYGSGLTVSVAGHALLFLILGLNLVLLPSASNQPVRLAIEAAVVPDMEAVRQREEAAQRRIEEQRAAERKRREEEQVRLAEQRRKEEAERQRRADEQRRQEELARQERERQEAERRRREEAEARRKAEEQRRQAEREAELRAQLAAEEQRLAAVESGLLDQYIAVIQQRVERNWVRPPSARAGLECEVRVSQIPGGEVVDVRLGRCNGDEAVIRSIENAVFRASPLPPPPDPALFERTLIFVFKPEE